MKPVLSIGFRRSGNHLLIETIRKNFDVPISRYKCAHIVADLHAVRVLRDAYILVYPYRNVLDVMRSLHKFYLSGAPQKWDDINIEVPEDYTAFMGGETIIHRCNCPQIERLLEDPLTFYDEVFYLEFMNGVYSVRYADLVAEPEKEIMRMSEHFNWPLKNDKPIPVTKKVGP